MPLSLSRYVRQLGCCNWAFAGRARRLSIIRRYVRLHARRSPRTHTQMVDCTILQSIAAQCWCDAPLSEGLTHLSEPAWSQPGNSPSCSEHCRDPLDSVYEQLSAVSARDRPGFRINKRRLLYHLSTLPRCTLVRLRKQCPFAERDILLPLSKVEQGAQKGVIRVTRLVILTASAWRTAGRQHPCQSTVEQQQDQALPSMPASLTPKMFPCTL